MKALLSMVIGFVLGVATLWGVQALSPTSPSVSAVTSECPILNGPEASSEMTATDASPLPETNNTVNAANNSDSNRSTDDYPEVDLPHPIFGYFRSSPGNFPEWDQKLAAESIDYHWQAQLEMNIRNSIAMNPSLKGADFRQLDCRQTGCRLVVGFTVSDKDSANDHIRILQAVSMQPWAESMPGSGSSCQSEAKCEAVFYFSRDPVNDPEMETIPWRRRG